MSDSLTCMICGFEGLDLRYHIERCHKMTSRVYKESTGGQVVAASVLEKRRVTSRAKYGQDHFTNRPAANLSFQSFEGGHPFSDPSVREKASDTMEKLYGSRHYTNRDKAKLTSMGKYGVEYTCAAPEVIKKRVSTLKDRYGKVFNIEQPHNKWSPEDLNLFSQDFHSGLSMPKMAEKYSVSVATIKRQLDSMGLVRSPEKVLKEDRVAESPKQVVSDYFEHCLSGAKAYSFYEYGKIRGQKYDTKMRRLFNKGKKYYTLKGALFEAALDVSKQSSFIELL